jgi:toxin FitB
MNLVDSSAWIEYFIGSELSLNFVEVIENFEELIVPGIVIFEVYKYILRERNEDYANEAYNFMLNGKIIPLTAKISKNAASMSIKHKLPMADSIIYTIAHLFNSIIYTQDEDFKGLPNVIFFNKNQ